MGPCMEYFVGGMELGNMVFMQYKYFHDGSFEELKIKIIDTGIGMNNEIVADNATTPPYWTAAMSTLQTRAVMFVLKFE